MVDKILIEKNYRKIDTEEVDLSRLHYLYTNAFSFFFFCFSFYLLELSEVSNC